MYIKQKELLSGLGKDFIIELMNITEKKKYGKGEHIFREGNHASRFYILLKGRVELTVGRSGRVVFILNHAGEAFGWSSLLGRNVHSTSAQCMDETTLLIINRAKFNMLLEQDPVNGLKLVRRLATMLGERLAQSYKLVASLNQAEISTSYGSGQIMEANPPL